MKRLYPFVLIVLLPSCEAFGQAAATPEVQQQFQAAADAAVQGNMPGAVVAGLGGLGTLLTVGIGKWLHKRAKESKEGQILA